MTLTMNALGTERKQAFTRTRPAKQTRLTRPADETASLENLLRNPGPHSASLLALNGALSAGDFLFRPAPSRESAWTAPGQASFRLGKRVFDILFAACALLFLAPVLLLCAAAIRAESRGPVLFRQRRLGKGRKTFSIVKFRTMIPDAEAVLNRVLETDPKAREEWEKDRKLRNDPRVTRLGRFMRRSSLDELPQFWNVLVGEMSVIGPRPIVTAEIPFYREAYKAYCAVRPGITGLWQVSGRNDTGYGQRVCARLQVRRIVVRDARSQYSLPDGSNSDWCRRGLLTPRTGATTRRNECRK